MLVEVMAYRWMCADRLTLILSHILSPYHSLSVSLFYSQCLNAFLFYSLSLSPSLITLFFTFTFTVLMHHTLLFSPLTSLVSPFFPFFFFFLQNRGTNVCVCLCLCVCGNVFWKTFWPFLALFYSTHHFQKMDYVVEHLEDSCSTASLPSLRFLSLPLTRL